MKWKKPSKRIWTTLFLLIALGATLSIMTTVYYHVERDRCFRRLTGYVDQVAAVVDQNLEESRNYLESVAEIMKCSDWTDDETLQHQLDVLSGMGIVSQLELLLPGDQILPPNGDRIDAGGLLSFEKEAEEGFHISFHQGLAQQSLAAVRACLPVEKDGETAAVLCGSLDLERLADVFPGLDYGTEMQFFIIEKETRQFLLDTWHEHPANMDELQDRKAEKGYSREQFTFDFSQGNSGVTVFRSEKANENFYTGYAPVHEEDWTVQDIQREKLESEQNLKNVTYILDVEQNLFFAHTQPEHFRDALQAIASFTTAEVAFFWGISLLDKAACGAAGVQNS